MGNLCGGIPGLRWLVPERKASSGTILDFGLRILD